MSIKKFYFVLLLSLCLVVPTFAGIKNISKNDDGDISSKKTTDTTKKKSKNNNKKSKKVKKIETENKVEQYDEELDAFINEELNKETTNTEKKVSKQVKEETLTNVVTETNDIAIKNENVEIAIENDIANSTTEQEVNTKSKAEKINVYENISKKKNINVSKYYAKAKSAYWQNNITEAQMYLDAILSVEDYQKAYELKNKILLLEEKVSFLKKDIINTYSIELKRTLKEANFYEGFLLINKILALNPTENVAYSKSRLTTEEETIYQVLETKNEQKIFKNSVDSFSKGYFTEAKKNIKKLSQKYPRFSFYVSVVECYQVEESNADRIKLFYDKALDAVKSNKIYMAKNYIELAYGLDRYNLKVLILMEQINMELM